MVRGGAGEAEWRRGKGREAEQSINLARFNQECPPVDSFI